MFPSNDKSFEGFLKAEVRFLQMQKILIFIVKEIEVEIVKLCINILTISVYVLKNKPTNKSKIDFFD